MFERRPGSAGCGGSFEQTVAMREVEMGKEGELPETRYCLPQRGPRFLPQPSETDPSADNQELKERIEELREIKSEDSTSRSVSSEEMMEIRKAFVTIHGEMVLLKNYSSLNFAGLVKILKKYDKRTGGLLSLPFTRRALHQPFFTTEPLT